MKKRGSARTLFTAVATLTGTVIGAGFLGIPHVVAQSGFLVGVLHILVIGALMLFMHLYLGEISLRTKGIHQLPGYAERYLGKPGKVIVFATMVFALYSALIAYMIGEGEILSFIFFGTTQLAFPVSIIFFIFMSLLVYKGFSTFKKAESFALPAVLTLVLIIALVFGPQINMENLQHIGTDTFSLFLPYGVVLFAFLGFSALPELEHELKGNEKLMKKAIVIGSLIPIIVYLLFTFVIVGFAGKNTPEVATIALGRLPSILAVFTMFTAFFALSIALKEMYRFDFGFSRKTAWLLSSPLALVLYVIVHSLGFDSFVKIMGIGGAISGGVIGIVVLLMLHNAKHEGNRKPEYSMTLNWFFIAVLIAIFVLGILYQLVFQNLKPSL